MRILISDFTWYVVNVFVCKHGRLAHLAALSGSTTTDFRKQYAAHTTCTFAMPTWWLAVAAALQLCEKCSKHTLKSGLKLETPRTIFDLHWQKINIQPCTRHPRTPPSITRSIEHGSRLHTTLKGGICVYWLLSAGSDLVCGGYKSL